MTRWKRLKLNLARRLLRGRPVEAPRVCEDSKQFINWLAWTVQTILEAKTGGPVMVNDVVDAMDAVVSPVVGNQTCIGLTHTDKVLVVEAVVRWAAAEMSIEMEATT